MNELHVTLEALDLTSDERMELNGALALMDSVEGAKVTTTAILQKYYELVFAQTIAMLCETPEGTRSDAYLFEEAVPLANYRYFQSSANMARKMAEHALDDTKDLLIGVAESLEKKATESAKELWDFLKKHGVVDAAKEIDDDAWESFKDGARDSVEEQLLEHALKGTKLASLKVFSASFSSVVVGSVGSISSVLTTLNDAEEARANGESETQIQKDLVQEFTTATAGFLSIWAEGMPALAAGANFAARAALAAKSGLVGAGLTVAFLGGWLVGTGINMLLNYIPYFRDGDFLEHMESLFGKGGIWETRGAYESEFTQLCGLFTLLDPNVSSSYFNEILDASGETFQNLNEAKPLLNKVREVFHLEPSVFAEDNSNFIYETWKTVRETREWQGNVIIQSLLQFSPAELAQKAFQNSAGGQAYRYALEKLNPFAIHGLDLSAHNQAHELDLYDPVTSPEGTLTQRWIEDRAAMLAALIVRYQTDDERTTMDGQGLLYRDGTGLGNLTLRYGFSDDMDKTRILFGNDANETLNGGSQSDSLYGGLGNDALYGQEGANYLEGGKGDDQYFIVSDGKADTVLDVDRQGAIYLDGLQLTGGEVILSDSKIPAIAWRSSDGNNITYRLTDNDTTLEVIKNGDIQIRILDFVPGRFGINLKTSVDPDAYTAMFTLSPSGYDQVLLSNYVRSVATGTLPDSVTGTAFNDYVILGSDNDNAQTTFGQDIVFGQEGSDYIMAGPIAGDASREDRDYVEGGDGRDILHGGMDDDILHAGNAGDHLADATPESAKPGDWVDGGAGVDTLYGSQASDFLQGGASVDTIHGGAGDDVILGDGEIRQTIRFSPIPGSSSTFFWQEKYSRDGLYPTSGASVPYTLPASFAWNIAYGANRDNFALLLEVGQSFSSTQRSSVNGGSDTIEGGKGNDWIAGQKGGDIINGGEGDDVLYGDDVDPLPEGHEGDDTLIAGEGADRLFGGGGDDRLLALEYDKAQDTLYGGSGNDELRGGTGHDKLYGDAGYDHLYAGEDGSELYGGDDGDVLYSHIGNDHLEGGDGDDRFYGSAGEDVYLGGEDADTYYFQSSSLGVSTIRDASTEDRLNLDGAAFEEIAFVAETESRWHSEDGRFVLTLDGGTLTIQPLAGTGRVVVENYTPGVLGIDLSGEKPDDEDNHAPEIAAAATNLSVLEDEILNVEVPATLFSDPDGDALTYKLTLANGAPIPNWLAFYPPNRTLSGIPGNEDVGTVNLRLTATDPEGLSASQTFSITVENVNDAPEIGSAQSTLIATEDTAFSYYLPASLFSDPDDDPLNIMLTRADGGLLPTWLAYDIGSRRLIGTPDNDDVGSTLLKVTATDPDGLSVSQTFTLTVKNTNDDPEATGNIADVEIQAGKPFVLDLSGDLFTDPDQDDTLTLKVTLADGSPLPDWLTFDPLNQKLVGTPGAGDAGKLNLKLTAIDAEGAAASIAFAIDVHVQHVINTAPEAVGNIPAQSGQEGEAFTLTLPETLFSDPDDDELSYAVTQADGSALPAWLTFNPATRALSGTPGAGDAGNLSLKVTASDGSLSAHLGFALSIAAAVVYNPITGTASSNILSGTAQDDHAQGLAGNDTLLGYAGNDWLEGNAGNDTLYGGTGNDRLEGHDGNDTLHGEAGDDTLRGGIGNDTLYGNAGNDILTGNAGADRLEGGAGDDIYILRKGDGEDIINNYDAASAALDTVRFEDIASNELTGLFRDGSDLILTYGDTDKLTLDNFYLSASYRVDRFTFTDATLTTEELLKRHPVQLSSSADVLTFTELGDVVDGLAGNDILYGSGGDDILSGNLGNDILHGGDDNDRLEGGDGIDTLYGEAGNDVLVGNAGNDRLEGGRGDDIYLFGRGDGQDVIYDYDTTKGNADTLVFGENIAADQLWFRKSGSNLEVSVLGGTSGDKVTINNWYTGSSGAYRVEAFQTADALLTQERVQTLVDAMSSYALPQDNSPEDVLQIIGSSWEAF